MRASRYLIALFLGFASTCFAQAPTWTHTCVANGPQAAYYPAMAYDAAHSQVVLFGGAFSDFSLSNDTWTWDGFTWTKQSPVTRPPARTAHAMAYDAARGQVVMFGGASAGGFLNDTWVWDGFNWTPKGAGPGARLHMGMAYDAARQKVVLFGGSVGTPTPLGDTWAWDGSSWTPKLLSAPLGLRSNYRLAYDEAHSQVVLFGGWNGTTLVNETWVWNGTSWAPKIPVSGPPPAARQDFAIAYDAALQRVVLFSGIQPPSAPVDDITWLWDGTNWTNASPAASPVARGGAAMAYDVAHGQLFLFGGVDSSQFFPETWTFGNANSTSAPAFAEVVRAGVLPPNAIPGEISTTFKPGRNLGLKEAACLGGYDHFNWKQTVLSHSLLDVCPLCVTPGLLYLPEGSVVPTLPRAPFIDPPHGGYLYMVAEDKCGLPAALLDPRVCWFPARDNLDWYWDEKYAANGRLPDPGSADADLRITQREFFTTSDVLTFIDTPVCPFYLNSLGVGSLCTVYFSTNLVGVKSNGIGEPLALVGTSFNWHLIGSTIGVDPRLSATGPIDPGTLVYFDGFKPPGAVGFTQAELELFAKSGINIRDEGGVVIPVVIDIKPGGFPNSINPSSSGKTPVAILSNNTFDAVARIDQTSITFGHTGGETSLAFCHSEDVNADGLPDLVCHFNTPSTGFLSGDLVGILKGKTTDGMPLFGKDSVNIVPK